MRIENFKYNGKERKVLVLKESDGTFEGVDLNLLTNSYTTVAEELVARFDTFMNDVSTSDIGSYRKFLREKIEK
jgi:hypothetical protein